MPRKKSRQGLPTFELRALEIFATVVETGNMTIAARRLGMTQPAVSQVVRQMESDLGAELLDRELRPLRTTPAGQMLYQSGRRLLADAEQIYTAVSATVDGALPHVRLGLVDSVAATIGPQLIKALRDDAQHLSVWSGISPGLEDDLINRDLDIIVTPDPMEEVTALTRRRLLREPFLLALPEAVGHTTPSPALEALARELPLIRYSVRSRIGAQVERHLRWLRIEAPQQLEFDGSEPVFAMVAGGLGWALTTPLCALQSRGYLTGVKLVPMPEPVLMRSLYLVRRKDEFGEFVDKMKTITSSILKQMLTRDLPGLVPSISEHIVFG